MTWVYPKKGSIGNMNEIREKWSSLLERFKYPLIALSVGVILMLIPGSERTEPISTEGEAHVADILSQVRGVGESLVLISDKGVVVVCQGADSARTRMEIIQAVSSYTGYSSDKITILKMVD